MVSVFVATLLAALLSAAIYLFRERIGPAGAGMMTLRTVAMGALFLGLFNPGRSRQEAGGAPLVLLDGSLSMNAAGGQWAAARDTATIRAGATGQIIQFGSAVQVAGLHEPTLGTSLVAPALRSAAGRTGPVIVVTDGEVEDVGAIAPSLLGRASVVTLLRRLQPDAALADVIVPARALESDSIAVTVVVAAWGGIGDSTVTLEVREGTRLLDSRDFTLPGPGTVVRRRFFLPAGALDAGTQVLRVTLTAPGDQEPRNDQRVRVITVTDQPDIVVLADPADVSARFLVRELRATARSAVRGFARLTGERWVDMVTLDPIPFATVRAAAAGAALVVSRGADAFATPGRGARWNWPAGVDRSLEIFEGDWYVTGDLPASPFAGRFAGIRWDSLPPLTGIVPVVPGTGEWIALSGRSGRRGADRPLLVGADSAGRRQLTTTASGMWRWALRGGASLEAYRGLLATGTDWLLEGRSAIDAASITASSVVQRGMPIAFQRVDTTGADSVMVQFGSTDSTETHTLRFDAAGLALVLLEPGEYRWNVVGAHEANGLTVVEEYSSEFLPGPVTLDAIEVGGGFTMIVTHARDTWWLFSIAIAALLGEWGWRQRRGLP